MERKEELKIIGTILKRVNDKSYPCLSTNCEQSAINSHRLQKNGILNVIAENDHLIQIKTNDVFKVDNEGPLKFKKVGINHAISYPIFCNNHDSSIFKPIEQEEIDFYSYKNQVLFSYRALCAERRKKERSIELFTRVLRSNALYNPMRSKALEERKKSTLLGIRDLNFYKDSFENDLITDQQNSTFKVLEFEPFKVSCSAVFSNELNSIYSEDETLAIIFVNVIPQKDKLVVIIGYNNEINKEWITSYLNLWESCTQDSFTRMLSDLLSRIESWAMAESIYKKISNETLTKFGEHFENTGFIPSGKLCPIDLFQELKKGL